MGAETILIPRKLGVIMCIHTECASVPKDPCMAFGHNEEEQQCLRLSISCCLGPTAICDRVREKGP